MAKSVNRDINARIKTICDEVFHGNLSQMAKSTFISRTTLISIIGDQQSSPGYEVLRKIVEMSTVKISETWLLTGEGEMIAGHNDETNIKSSTFAIPMIDIDAAAGFSEVDAPNGRMRMFSLPHCDASINVRGLSMEPYIHDGDIAAFVMLPSAASMRPDGVYIVQYCDAEGFTHITIKRAKCSPKGERYIRLSADNPEYGFEDVLLESISRVALVRYTITPISY